MPGNENSSGRVSPLRANSLGITGRDLIKLHEELDALERHGAEMAAAAGMPADGGGRARRRHSRLDFHKECVLVRVKHLTGQESVLKMASRNVSANGTSLLHNAYIHAGARCAIALPHATEQFIRVTGTVVRCTHRGGAVHEIGIKFDDECKIDVRDLLDLDRLMTGPTIENVDPEELEGTLVYVEDSEADQRIIEHYLRTTHLNIVSVDSFDEALEKAARADLLLVDFHLEGFTGADLVEACRKKMISCGVVIITSDPSANVREECERVAADAMLAKPVTQDDLLRVLAELLHSSKQGITSTLGNDPSVRELLDRFVAEMKESAMRMESMDDYEEARKLCLRMSQGASSLGFPQIADLAKTAATQLAATMSMEEARPAIQAFSQACRKAKAA